MLILLPPSETKRPGGDRAFRASELWHHRALGEARRQVRSALEELSRDPEAAAKTLKLGTKNRAELQHNLRLSCSGAMPAIERYTGVLYDALGIEDLPEPARSWIDAHVAVQSALFGVVRAGDPIPAYRLSGGSRLPELGAPLKRVWQRTHAEIDWAAHGIVLDLRSGDYQALAPIDGPYAFRLQVVQRAEDGTTRALNHFNKAAKGDLVRRLAESRADIGSADGLVEWAHTQQLDLAVTQAAENGAGGELTLVTDLGAPTTKSAAAGTSAADAGGGADVGGP